MDEFVVWFTDADMDLAHPYGPSGPDVEIRIAKTGRDRRLRSNGEWLTSPVDSIQTLIAEITSEDRAVGGDVGPAAVLVDAGSDVEIIRTDVGNSAGRRMPNDGASTGFRWAALDPIEVIAVDPEHIAEPESGLGHGFGRDG